MRICKLKFRMDKDVEIRLKIRVLNPAREDGWMEGWRAVE